MLSIVSQLKEKGYAYVNSVPEELYSQETEIKYDSFFDIQVKSHGVFKSMGFEIHDFGYVDMDPHDLDLDCQQLEKSTSCVLLSYFINSVYKNQMVLKKAGCLTVFSPNFIDYYILPSVKLRELTMQPMWVSIAEWLPAYIGTQFKTGSSGLSVERLFPHENAMLYAPIQLQNTEKTDLWHDVGHIIYLTCSEQYGSGFYGKHAMAGLGHNSGGKELLMDPAGKNLKIKNAKMTKGRVLMDSKDLAKRLDYVLVVLCDKDCIESEDIVRDEPTQHLIVAKDVTEVVLDSMSYHLNPNAVLCKTGKSMMVDGLFWHAEGEPCGSSEKLPKDKNRVVHSVENVDLKEYKGVHSVPKDLWLASLCKDPNFRLLTELDGVEFSTDEELKCKCGDRIDVYVRGETGKWGTGVIHVSAVTKPARTKTFIYFGEEVKTIQCKTCSRSVGIMRSKRRFFCYSDACAGTAKVKMEFEGTKLNNVGFKNSLTTHTMPATDFQMEEMSSLMYELLIRKKERIEMVRTSRDECQRRLRKMYKNADQTCVRSSESTLTLTCCDKDITETILYHDGDKGKMILEGCSELRCPKCKKTFGIQTEIPGISVIPEYYATSKQKFVMNEDKLTELWVKRWCDDSADYTGLDDSKYMTVNTMGEYQGLLEGLKRIATRMSKPIIKALSKDMSNHANALNNDDLTFPDEPEMERYVKKKADQTEPKVKTKSVNFAGTVNRKDRDTLLVVEDYNYMPDPLWDSAGKVKVPDGWNDFEIIQDPETMVYKELMHMTPQEYCVLNPVCRHYYQEEHDILKAKVRKPFDRSEQMAVFSKNLKEYIRFSSSNQPHGSWGGSGKMSVVKGKTPNN